MRSWKKQLDTAKLEVQQPFIKDMELTEKLVRVEELNALLNMDSQETERSEPEEDDELEL